MFPQTGNPDLDPVKEYNFSMKHRLSSVKKQISLNTEVRLKYYTDNVVYKRQYFKNNTILPEYDSYEFPAGSTLISPINGNDYWDLKISSSIQKQINYLGRLETIVGYTFRDPQSEVAGRLVRQQEHKGTFPDIFDWTSRTAHPIFGTKIVKNIKNGESKIRQPYIFSWISCSTRILNLGTSWTITTHLYPTRKSTVIF